MTHRPDPTEMVRRIACLLAEWREHTAGRLVADCDPTWLADWQARKGALLDDIRG